MPPFNNTRAKVHIEKMNGSIAHGDVAAQTASLLIAANADIEISFRLERKAAEQEVAVGTAI